MQKKKHNADSSASLSIGRTIAVKPPSAAYRMSVLQLISVASAVSFSIKVFSPVTSLIKSSSSTTTTTKDGYEKREAGLLAILFHPTRYYNESNRDPILIGDSLRRGARR